MQTEKIELFLDHDSPGTTKAHEEFVDFTSGKVQEVTDGEKKIGFHNNKPVYRMLGTKVNVINDNDRAYPNNVMSDAITEWKKSRKGAPGEAGHPQSYVQRNGRLGWRSQIENQVIKVLDVHYPDSDGNVFFDFQTIETQKGKDLQALIDQKIAVGCSMRAGGRGKKGTFGNREATIATFIDLYTFDILFDPALKDTLGTIQPLTDSEIESFLDSNNKKEENTQEYSDAVDPFIQRIKKAASIIETEEIMLEVDELELDAIDRDAFQSAYYRRRDQLWTKLRIDNAKKERARIGFTDEEEKDNMYTFDQLEKMTDGELKNIKASNSEYAAMCDSILASRATKKELDAFKDAEEKRKEKEAAEAFMDSDEVKDKLGKLPAAVQEKIRARVDLTNKDKAEQSFNDAFEFAATFMADEKLKEMGFSKEMTDAAPGTIHVQVNENPSWKEFTDKLAEATNDNHLMFEGVGDENLKKINKPIVDRLMKEFDAANKEKLSRFADDFSASSNTSTVLNGVAFQRQIIEQAFQTLVALQFVQTQAFSGEFMEIPRENYSRTNKRPSNNGEQQPMAKSKLSLDFIHVSAEARKLAAEITKEAQSRLESGPLNYDIMGRLVYHLANDLKRESSLKIHDEMLYSSDEFGAVNVQGETPDVDPERKVLTLLRGGSPGTPNKYVPIVKPRTTYFFTNEGKQSVVQNKIVVRVGAEAVDLTNAQIDFESGKIVFKDALSVGDITVDYSYATNIALFDLAVPDGLTAEKHFNKLIHLIGQQKALMGGEPRYYSPNFLLMSEGVSNEVSQAELFSSAFSKNGNELQPDGYVGKVKAIAAYEHNEPWSAGDSRILIGQRLATKYGIGTNMKMQGPFPTRDTNGELTGGDEIYFFLDDAINTPVKQVYRTIKLFNSKA